MTGRTRAQVLDDARALSAEIEEIFTRAAYWNTHERGAGEDLIDPDPKGQLQRLADNLAAMLTTDREADPIDPVA